MREVVLTKDGSHTISIPEKGLTYHSVHGAVQESMHVFIQAGFWYVVEKTRLPHLAIFEMGLGTGLNAFLTAIQAVEKGLTIQYTAVETTPLSPQETTLLNYPEALGHTALFQQIHHCRWNEPVVVNPFFTLEKLQVDLASFAASRQFNLVYFDAFAPSAQPELWTEEIFRKLFAMLHLDGVLVTYCSKGDVKRAMQATGFAIEKIPGPPGKREMLRAVKL